MLEEWGVKASPAGHFDEQVAVFNNETYGAVPWVYWEVVPGCDGGQGCTGVETKCPSSLSQGYDGYEIGLGGGGDTGKGDVRRAVGVAEGARAAQDWGRLGL